MNVFGLPMAYREAGSGPPMVFLHGNPTSSYLWRNVIALVQDRGHCIAPDLIGMGHSAKVPGVDPGRYRLVEHRRYLDELLEQLIGDPLHSDVILVGHDWGGVLAMDWARRHPRAVRGIAYLETLVGPVSSSGRNAPDPELFGPLRSEAGERLVLDGNFFVEEVLPAGTLRRLTDAEMAAYRQPFAEPGEGRRPTLTWPREIPIDGQPEDVDEIVRANADFMEHTQLPKLFVNGEPGALLTGPMREACRAWPNQREVSVPGLHFLPEDSPLLIGSALRNWIDALPSAAA